jgi:ParB-like chromosome segregation protein Spo0J
MKNRTEMKLEDLRMEPDAQARTAIRSASVEEYAEAMQDGASFPPIEVMMVDGQAIIIDGWHRVMAASQLGLKSIDCVVVEGSTIADAQWSAAAVNQSHGLRRTNADKARAVTLALAACPGATYQQIAQHCGVSQAMVSAYFAAMQEVDQANEVAVEAPRQSTRKAPKQRTLQDDMAEATASIEAAVTLVTTASASIEALTQSASGAYINAQSVLSDLSNAASALNAAKPHKVCPLCNGERCETCRMLGWVSKKQWQLIPKKMRGD